jgi:hypothetical protein
MAYTIGSVQMVADTARNFSGYGFVIHDEHKRACVTFAYDTEQEAQAAGEHIKAALSNAKSVVPGNR